MSIQFFSVEAEFKLSHPRKTTQWITASTTKEKAAIKSLSYIFCSDSYLLKLNQNFLSHDTLTDIITFDYSESKKAIEGEIYISIDRVKDNALKFEKTFEEELRRVIIHGVLHLIGYKDKKKEEKVLMRKKEDTYLSLWGVNVPRGTK